MSLDWTVDKIVDYMNLCWLPDLNEDGTQKTRDGEPLVRINPITDCLIWDTMCVEIGKITEKNFEEFHRRMVEAHEQGIASTINYYDKVAKDWKVRIPTLAEVKAHIGLSTNVGSRRGKNPGIGAFNKKIRHAKKRNEPKPVFPEDYQAPGKMNSLTSLAREVR